MGQIAEPPIVEEDVVYDEESATDSNEEPDVDAEGSAKTIEVVPETNDNNAPAEGGSESISPPEPMELTEEQLELVTHYPIRRYPERERRPPARYEASKMYS
ncbi:hypothetical protein FGB62_174g012 [Gracilaria domingensis]|nr:hypothetical protein FGB62_174g012 [Gracilaria domingensis]